MNAYVGGGLLYAAVRNAAIRAGVDMYATPYKQLNEGSREFWAGIWQDVELALLEDNHIIGSIDAIQSIASSPWMQAAMQATKQTEAEDDEDEE